MSVVRERSGFLVPQGLRVTCGSLAGHFWNMTKYQPGGSLADHSPFAWNARAWGSVPKGVPGKGSSILHRAVRQSMR